MKLRALLLGLVLVAPQAFAAITYIGSGTADGDVNDNTITPDVHASTTTGDAIIVVWGRTHDDADGGQLTTGTAITGYTQIGFSENTGAEPQEIALYCRIATGADTVSATSPSGTDGTGDANMARTHTFRGTATSCASIVAHVAASGTDADTGCGHPALTVTTDNTVVIAACTERTAWTSVAVLTTSGLGWAEIGDDFNTSGEDVDLATDYVIETTAASVAAGSFARTGGANENSAGITISLAAAGGSPPSFSAGPAAGTPTSTTIPTTFTTDQNSTTEGVACADGAAAPDATEIKADQCDGGGAAPSSFDEATVATVADGHTFTGLSAGTVYDLHFVATDGDGDSAVSSVADVTTVTTPAYTAGPTLGTPGPTTLPFTFTTNHDTTATGVACTNGQTATCDQVQAGNCSGGAAIATYSEATVATVGDSATFSGLTASTTYDTFHCLVDGDGVDATVQSVLDAVTAAAGTVEITDVDTDEIVTATQLNVVLTGTNFGAVQGTGTVTLRQSGNSKTLSVDSWADTSIQVDMSGTGMGVADGLRYGSADIRVTVDGGGSFDDAAITINAPSGTIYADLSGGLVTLDFDFDGNPNRVFGDPIDVLPASQVALRNASGCTLSTDVTINADGSLTVDDSCTAFDYDFTDDDGAASSHLYIGTVNTISWAGGPPHFGAIDIEDHVLAVGLAMTGYDIDDYFVVGDGAISARAMRQQSTPADSTTDVNGAVSDAILLVVDDASVLLDDVGNYLRCATGIPVKIKYANPLTNGVGLWSQITCADNAQVDVYADGAGSVSQVTVNSGTGAVSGTPDTDATTTELIYRVTDANGLTADVRVPFQIDVVTIPDVTADDLAGGTTTLDALGIDVTPDGTCSFAEARNEILSQASSSGLWATLVELDYVTGCGGRSLLRLGLGFGL